MMFRPLKLICFSILLFSAGAGVAQDGFSIGHYMMNPSYFNPGWSGFQEEAFFTAHHKSQWTGYEATSDNGGAPSTQMLSFVIPTNWVISGLGITVVNDRLALASKQELRFSIASKAEFGFGSISVGLMPSIEVFSLGSEFRFVDGGDGSIPTEQSSQLVPNFHAGIIFQSKKSLFIGLSTENLLRPSFNLGVDGVNQLAFNHSLIAGTEVGLARDLVLRPSVLIRSNLSTTAYDLSLIAVYEDRLWAGASYRRDEAIGILVGYSFLEDNKMSLGYSFDYIISNREAKQNTSNEIFIRYNLPDLVLGGKKAIKTPRFTF